MKFRLLALVLLIAVGVLVAMSAIQADANVEKQYQTHLSTARYYVEKQIPYNACGSYKKAFAIHCEDEAIFQEYLNQAQLLGRDLYEKAISEYIENFPTSAKANELHCQVLYERGSYKKLIEAALKARDLGVATEQVKNWYLECSYMTSYLSGSYQEAQSFLGGTARVKLKDAYGYVSTGGKLILPAKYLDASLMYNGSAAVNDGEEWHMINAAGYKVARTSEPVDFLSARITGQITVAKDGKYGFTDASLKIPEELPYDYASLFKGGVAAVKKGDSWALINTEMKNVTEFIFEDVLLNEYGACCNGGVIFVKKDGKYYMVNPQGARITDQAFDAAQPFVGSQPAAVCIDGLWGFVDTTGNMVIKPEFEAARSFSLNLAGVCKEGKWGFIGTSGELRIDYEYDDCKYFTSAGIAAVKVNDNWRYIQLITYRQ